MYYQASTTTAFLYDSLTPIQSSSGGSSPVNNYLAAPGGGEVFAFSQTSGSNTTALVPIHDALGSTVALVNSSYAMATQYTYEPFGNFSVSGTGSIYPYLFAGMEYDYSTGLYHTLARTYSPSLSRFLSEDPLGYGGGSLNLFAYAGNEPVDNTDPTGTGSGCQYGDCAPESGYLIPISPVIPGFPSPPRQVRGGLQGMGVGGSALVVAQAQATRSVPLYRAVQDSELNQILETGSFQIPEGGIEGKTFSTSAEGAACYAKQAYRAWPHEGPYSLVKSSIPEDLITPDMVPETGVDGGIQSIVVPAQTLPQLATPEIQTDMPIEGIPPIFDIF